MSRTEKIKYRDVLIAVESCLELKKIKYRDVLIAVESCLERKSNIVTLIAVESEFVFCVLCVFRVAVVVLYSYRDDYYKILL